MNFSSKYRLLSKQDFQSVFAHPYKITRKHFLALYCPNQQTFPRLGIIISKRHIKNAVDRNRFRRVVRESFRHHKEMIKGLDIVVIVRSKCTAADKTALRESIDQLWPALIIPSNPSC